MYSFNFCCFFILLNNAAALFFGILCAIFICACIIAWGYNRDTLREDNKIRARLKLLKIRLKHAEQSKFQSLDYRQQYLQRVPEFVTTYRRKAGTYRHWYTNTQLLTIFLSALITSVSGGWLDPYIHLTWLTPLLGLLVSILTGITLHFRFREKSYNLQQTADVIDLEYNAYRLAIHTYNGKDKEQSLTTLAERIENFRDEQQKREQQLEQSSQGDQKTPKPTSKAARK